MNDEKLTFSSLYVPVTSNLHETIDLFVGNYFKKHWNDFKQINIRNFESIGVEHAEANRNQNLRNVIILLSNIYQDWIVYLNSQNKSHYDGIYLEFRDYLLSPNSYFYENSETMLVNYPGLFDYSSILQVLAFTYRFEHPDVIQDWRRTNKRKTRLQRFFYHNFN